jgi:hypothetical protein
MENRAIRGNPVAGLNSGGTGTDILPVHDHGLPGLAHEGWGVGRGTFGVDAGVADIRANGLGGDGGCADVAAGRSDVLVALESVRRDGALGILYGVVEVVVEGMVAADGVLGVDDLVTRVVGGDHVYGPKALFEGWAVHGTGGTDEGEKRDGGDGWFLHAKTPRVRFGDAGARVTEEVPRSHDGG